MRAVCAHETGVAVALGVDVAGSVLRARIEAGVGGGQDWKNGEEEGVEGEESGHGKRG